MASILGGLVSFDRGGLYEVLARHNAPAASFSTIRPRYSYLAPGTSLHLFSPTGRGETHDAVFWVPVSWYPFPPFHRPTGALPSAVTRAHSTARTSYGPSTSLGDSSTSTSSSPCLGPHWGFQKIAPKAAQFLVLTAA